MDRPSTTPAAEGSLLKSHEDGDGGMAAGVCEAFLLIWYIPGFGCVSLFSFFLMGGMIVGWTFVLPNLEKEVWGASSASNTAWMQAARCLLSVLLCAHFGMWSDRHNRKAAVAVVAVASMIVVLPVLPLGYTETSLNIVVVLVVLTGPFAAHLSGSPILWAWASDYLAPEHKEIGFAIIGVASSAGGFVIAIGAQAAAHMYPGDPAPFLWITIGCLIACLGIVAIAPPGAYMPDLADADVPKEKGVMEGIFGPLRLVASKPTLRATCVVVGLLTLPDMAAQDVSSQIIISLHDYITPCGGPESPDVENCVRAAVSNTMNVLSVFPLPVGLVVVVLIGVCGRRYGPHRLVRVWVPLTAIGFAVPAILKATFETWSIFVSGIFIMLPLTNYIALQALITHIVHPRQIGEAMGAIATCKNFVSLLAPLIVGGITSVLERSGHTTYPNSELYIIYPVCALVMFCASPFTFCLEKRVPRDTTMTWNTWASAARPSKISSALQARSSAMFSARP